MASVTLEKLTKTYAGGASKAVNELTLDIAGRRVPGAGRPVGLRQVDGAAHDRRSRGDHRRRRLDRRRVRQRRAPEGPRHRDGVPELRALSAHDGVRQHRLPAADREAARRPRSRERVLEAARILELENLSEAPARPALGRPAPARRDGPRHRAQAGRLLDGRAALQPRRQAARADARRDRRSCSIGSAPRPSTSRTTRSRR